MYTLKSIARRGTALGMATAMLVAAVMPAASVFAQSAGLNPLTERSLLLSSSAPGFIDTDGSGYSTGSPNPASVGNLGTPGTYAPAGSGPNGKKSGQTFSFRASSTDNIQALTLQYCTTAAGLCKAPGNNDGDGATRQANEDTGVDPAIVPGGWSGGTSDFDITGSFGKALLGATPAGGQFQISVNGTPTSTDDWAFSVDNWEDAAGGGTTGKSNLITLRSTTGTQINAGDYVEVKFVASESVFITNPGAGHFFVKINTYNDGTLTGQLPNVDSVSNVNENIVDGGVTVANVMTDSIHITTKVLETMSFSVGIENPDTVTMDAASDHIPCDIISQTSTVTGLSNNRLNLGNPFAEYSLETTKAWDVYSYWRLSSNSSGGATVYYSGNTLANTVGDEIAAMTTGNNGGDPGNSVAAIDPARSAPGAEQFGLGFVDISSGDHADDLSDTFEQAVADPTTAHANPNSFPFITVLGQTGSPFDTLSAAQPVSTDYNRAAGTIDDGASGQGTARFKFLPSSLTVPEPIAQQNETVVSCATAKMRYVGNIAPDTPAGVYTTKVNYLAAPQY